MSNAQRQKGITHRGDGKWETYSALKKHRKARGRAGRCRSVARAGARRISIQLPGADMFRRARPRDRRATATRRTITKGRQTAQGRAR